MLDDGPVSELSFSSDTSAVAVVQEVQQQSPVPKKFEPIAAIPWCLTIVVPIITYWLGRRSKAIDDVSAVIVGDIGKYLEKVEALSLLIAAHQAGTPARGDALSASREGITTTRKEISSFNRRISVCFKKQSVKDSWQLAYSNWRQACEADSGLITDRRKRWDSSAISSLEAASAAYLETVQATRHRVASKKIKLR